MSEARAVTNFSGNAVATLLIGTWTRSVDRERVDEVLSGRVPFDESMLGDDDMPEPPKEPSRLEKVSAVGP